MRCLRQLAVLLAVAVIAPTAPGAADGDSDAVPLSADEIKRRWHSRLDAHHFVARITLEMNLAGLRETRELLVWRDDDGAENERVMVRFESPPDLRSVALLYLEHGDRPNDYFLYQAAIRRIRRLPETVANDDVYGIDLEFLGFGVAQSEPTEIESVSRDKVGSHAAYKLVERATRSNPRFDRRSTWLDQNTFLALRTEHERAGRVVLVAEVSAVQQIQGIPTPTTIHFERNDVQRSVRLHVRDVDYERAIPESYFSAMALLRTRVKSDSR